MANYSLVINSKFNPYSYQELLAPVQQSTEAHQNLETQYAELGAKADAWKEAAMREPDSQAAQMYLKYSNDLEERTRQLAREGLNVASRQNMLDMYRRYSSEIQPIETAYNNREADIKRQTDITDKDPSVMWSSNASMEGLDSYLGGRRPEYYQVSGTSLLNSAKAAANAYASRLFNTAEGRRFNGEYLDWITTQGVTPAQAVEILSHKKDSNGNYVYPEFEKMIDRVRNDSNYAHLSDADKAKADSYILEGMNEGLGYSEKHDLKEDWRSRLAYQASLSGRGAGASGASASVYPAVATREFHTDEATRKDRRKGVQNDSMLRNEWLYNIDSTDQDTWRQRITEASKKDKKDKNGLLYEAQWDNENKRWIPGKAVNMSDAFGTSGKASSVQFSQYGRTFEITDDNTSKRYMLPSGIDSNIDANYSNTMQNLGNVVDIIEQTSKGAYVPIDPKVREDVASLTGRNVNTLPDAWTSLLLAETKAGLINRANYYISQLGGTNKTESQNWNYTIQ